MTDDDPEEASLRLLVRLNLNRVDPIWLAVTRVLTGDDGHQQCCYECSLDDLRNPYVRIATLWTSQPEDIQNPLARFGNGVMRCGSFVSQCSWVKPTDTSLVLLIPI